MADGNNNHGPALNGLMARFAGTALGALRNRGELLIVELQEEKARAIGLLICGIGLLFLALATILLLTATIIFLFPEELRIYAAGGFTLLYLIGSGIAFFALKRLLKQAPFAATLAEIKKDKDFVESLR